jgi:hypothetical protein
MVSPCAPNVTSEFMRSSTENLTYRYHSAQNKGMIRTNGLFFSDFCSMMPFGGVCRKVNFTISARILLNSRWGFRDMKIYTNSLKKGQ